MSRFQPVAIVAQSIAVPGAFTPGELFDHALAQADLLSTVPEGRWRIDPNSTLGAPGTPDRVASLRGGYVRGLEDRFSAGGFSVPESDVAGLDRLFHLTLHVTREALEASGASATERARTGLVLGNLSFPSAFFSAFAESVWGVPGSPAVDARNRFMSGYPALFAARALGLGLADEAFALDAACASSLYAIKLACDALNERRADTMLAAAVSCADDLFIHMGFSALRALSPSGRSRPFHQDADGLVPAEGAGCVALRRLADAERSGDRILGVIRGIGLSNDGRGSGLLSPSEEGQVRALRAAYESAGLPPGSIGLLECHATGTQVGDAVEVASANRVFGERGGPAVPSASIKGNLGHLITAAGMAGLSKILTSFERGVKAPSAAVDRPSAALKDAALRLLQQPEPWGDSPRLAGISAFGFGGNNAHLIVEQWTSAGASARQAAPVPPPNPPAAQDVAVVSLAVRAGRFGDMRAFADAVIAGDSVDGASAQVLLDATGLRFPPRDLEETLAQQTLLLSAAQEALAGLDVPFDRAGVFVGMGCDPEVARYGARWRLLAAGRGVDADAIAPPLDPAGVLGAMPNIVANRLSSQWDCRGPAFTVSAEELSGARAIGVASDALRLREVDAALVAVVDLSAEAVHTRAAGSPGGDAAALLVLMRADDARGRGLACLAAIDRAEQPGPPSGDGSVRPRSFAAGHLVAVAAEIVRTAARVRARSHAPAAPNLAASPVAVPQKSRFGAHAGLRVRPKGVAFLDASVPALTFQRFCGRNADDVAQRLASPPAQEAGGDEVRLALVGRAEDAERLRNAARDALLSGGPLPPGAFLGPSVDAPGEGEIALVFTGPAGAYREMGRDLALAFPELAAHVAAGWPTLAADAGWVYETGAADIAAEEKLWGAAYLSQLHAAFTRRVLKIAPGAVLGMSSGETNSLFAMDAWRDVTALRDAIRAEEMYTRVLAGRFEASARAWGESAPFENWRILAPVEVVRDALRGEDRAHLTIIQTRTDVSIGGHPDACARVVARVGGERCRKLGYDLVIHAPELGGAAAEAWKRIHTRETADVPGVRFYTHATGSHYAPTRQSCAEYLLRQAQGTLDFPALVERAWHDGTRTFIEHGPRSGCTRWISSILGARPHLAIALDESPSVSSLETALRAAARLWVERTPVDLTAIDARLASRTPAWEPRRPLTLPVRRSLPAITSRLPEATHAAGSEARRLPEPPRLRSPRRRTGSAAQHRSARVPVRTDAPALTAFEPVAPPLALPRSTARPTGFSEAGPVGAVARAFREVVARHNDFVSTQHALHDRFLALRGRIFDNVAEPVIRSVSATAPSRVRPTGAPVLWDRGDLVTLSSGRVSDVFGPAFVEQDGFARQVRMPEPPLLLADRVVSISGEPHSMGRGSIRTETDVGSQPYYLHENRMPAGILIESGQADLLLISWLGVDRLNRGERVYRLLGCELTYHGHLPTRGETLRYDIHVDGHAQQGDVRLFFFHYDCVTTGVDGAPRPQLTVRGGQAGFFTDAELSTTGGVLWSAESETPDLPPVTPAPVEPARAYDREQVVAFSEGRIVDAFGRAHVRAATHTMTPRIASGDMRLIDSVEELDPSGGPWKRGYLRAALPLADDDWFFKGHFKNDPCMPGTLMFEGCLQAMAFYLAACGFTLDRDAWRFEPVPERPYALRCRGQALPSSRRLVYELFVAELLAGPEPTLVADVLCTVDGVKAFHARRLALRLTPDFPMSRSEPADASPRESQRVAYDERPLLATAWGPPTVAFGPAYAAFDGTRRLPRLPSPPYKFLDRVASFDGASGSAGAGSSLVAEYDVPAEAWYFEENGGVMPWAVLLEAALQPCGWLALATGLPLRFDEGLYFRNLDGVATVWRNVAPGSGTLRTRVRLSNLSSSGGISLVSFEVACEDSRGPVLSLGTSFGFFPSGALARQVGLKTTERESRLLAAALSARDGARLDTAAAGGRRLSLVTRVLAVDQSGGEAGLGLLIAEHSVDPEAWFFKAHFFQDPVQPGSLGIHMMLEALTRLAHPQHLSSGRLGGEALAPGVATRWKYRGQVLPENGSVIVVVEVTGRRDLPGPSRALLGRGCLFVDGLKIYEADDLSVLLD